VPARRPLAIDVAFMMSFVQTAAARPYIVLLPRSITSSRPSNGMMDNTGPKISSWAIFHFIPDVGKHRWLDEVSPLADSPSAAQHFRALLPSGVDVTHHLVELGGVDLRPLFGLRIEGIADCAAPGAIHATLDELVVRLAFHEQPRFRRSSTGPG